MNYGTDLFPKFKVIPTMSEIYVQHAEKLMKESWEAETSMVNREVVDPLTMNLKETPRRKQLR
jgi:hypothetical protein